MSRGPAYDANQDNGGSSSEERGRARLRGDGNLALTLALRQQPQHQTVVASSTASFTASSGRVSPGADPGGLLAAPSIHRSRSRSVAPSLPIPIPGAAGSRRAAFRSAALAERLAADSDNSGTDSRDASPDPAGRLHQLPAGTRLPPPPPLTEEQLERARTLGAQPNPPYPLRPPSPGSLPVFGPITYAEYMRRLEQRANEYRVF
ncbi:hypothetical protein LX32DRAFT_691270 [Colletotrichum zoysiae]|uniref:Uncharacterized protein n=1 Tax=Colletotrichum zoysiae TaxID=1216348 RepID=A0AAD9HPS1_9PEZI|nr:hypothetical protein LX32DRAFT_691270 [Colletotrichum zoysiae]